VATILLVSIDATVQHVRRAIAAVADWTALLQSYQANLGRVVLLGLELLIAADIVAKVAVKSGYGSLCVLALVNLIRTFLRISFDAENEGRWPWLRLEAERRSIAVIGGCKPPGATSCGYAEPQW